MMDSVWLKQQGDDTSLAVFVQAPAKSNGIVGEHGAWLKLRIAAPRVEGLANDSLIIYLAKVLGVGRKDITIVNGELAKYKVLNIRKTKAAELCLKILQEIERSKSSAIKKVNAKSKRIR